MKKSILTPLLLAASAAVMHGQGIIQFNNYSAAGDTLAEGYKGQVLWATGTPVTDPNVEVQLFWADGAASSFANEGAFLAVAHAGLTTFIVPAYTFNGGGWYSSSQNQSLDTATGPVTFAVEAWETAGLYGGATYAASSEEGISGLWQEVAAVNASSEGIQPSSFPAQPFLNGPPTMLVGIPEPATFVLVGFGTAIILLRRRA